jgi:L-threonylcarbamoyladenylate synthase
MVTVDPASPDESVLREAGRILAGGGLVVIPTETVYGIAASALSSSAVSRLRAAKSRPETKPLPVMVSGASDMDALAAAVPPLARELARRFWPGPLTLVLVAASGVGEFVHAGTGKVGLRAPNDRVAQGVLAEAGVALVLTSANRSGAAPATTAQEAFEALGDRVDLYLDAGPCALGEPSTVLDLTTIPPTVLRAGAISADDLRAATI